MRVSVTCASILCVLASAAAAGEVKLTVQEPTGVARAQWPVTSGIPLAEGELKDDQACALFEAAGKEVPLQTECLCRWADGSVRWLLLDFQIDLAAKETKAATLRYGKDIRRSAVTDPVRVTKGTRGMVKIESGPVRLEYNSEFGPVFTPQGEAYLRKDSGYASAPITSCVSNDGICLYSGTDGTSCFQPMIEDIAVEQSGPIRICIRVSGSHHNGDRGKCFQYVARVHAWRGQPYVRVLYTFINDRQDVLMAKIQSLQWNFMLADHVDEWFILDGKFERKGELLQTDEAHCIQDNKPSGARACPWAAVGGPKGGLAFGLREFWQNWPKGIRLDPPCRFSLDLCPELPKDLYAGKKLEEETKLYYYLRDGMYTFKTGVAKTHEIWINYLSGKTDVKTLDEFFRAAEDPLLAVADPAYACQTKAMGDFPPADLANPKKFAGYDAWFDTAMKNHLKLRDKDREYGMLNYGDWYGERKVNWGNLEYDLSHGMFVQYLRTGDRRYFLRGEQAARHHIDVDVVHATSPLLKNPWGPPPEVGDVWLHCVGHTGGYYENAPLPVDKTYQMGHSTNFGHVWVGGDFAYYFLTGDRRAKEVGIDIADAMARHCPTAYGTHIRNQGWPIVLLMNAYEATGDKKYLDAATVEWEVLKKNIDWKKGWVVRLAKDHCFHPGQTCYGNVPFMEGLTISGLARYHRVTKNPEVLQAMTVGIDQMIRECWVEEDKAFRYTACPLSPHRAYDGSSMSAEGMAYEAKLTGNAEHLRVLREGLTEMLRKTGGGGGKSLGQYIHFVPYALGALE